MPYLLRTIYTCYQYLLQNGILQEVVVAGNDPSWHAGASDRVGRCSRRGMTRSDSQLVGNNMEMWRAELLY